MAEEPAALDPVRLQGLLATRWLGRRLHLHQELESTSNEAVRLAREGASHGTVVLADRQSAGRGRLGRPWHSPPGDNLYFSAVLRPALEPAAAPPLSLAAAVGICCAVQELLAKSPVQIKWPNDLLCRGRKLCGILLEMSADTRRISFAVLGVGLNVNLTAFPDELAGLATSLRLERGTPLDRLEVLSCLLGQLELWLDRLERQGPAPVLRAWQERAPWIGQTVTVHQAQCPITGTALGLDELGALRLRTADGNEHRILAGDLSWPSGSR